MQRTRSVPCLARSLVSRRSTNRMSGPAKTSDRLDRGERQTLFGEFVLMQADTRVGGHRDVHHFRIGQLQIIHQLDIFVDRAHLQPRIVVLLLADGGDGVALVVMGGNISVSSGSFRRRLKIDSY